MHVTMRAHDLIQQMLAEGLLTAEMAEQARGTTRNIAIALDVELDAYDAASGCSDESLIMILEGRGALPNVDVDTDAIGEGIGYALAGDRGLADAMFARGIGGDVDMAPIERALRS